MSDLERVAIVCVGRYGPRPPNDIWYDVEAWNLNYDEVWSREQYDRVLIGLRDAGFVEFLGGGLAVRLAPKGEGYRLALEEEMQSKGVSCNRI